MMNTLPAQPERDVHYTAFIRLPFPRGEFVDPPLIDWDGIKDQALWKILFQNPKAANIKWKDIAQRFDVPLDFILQQAAWLYERQLSQVREQMQNITTSSPMPATQALVNLGPSSLPSASSNVLGASSAKGDGSFLRSGSAATVESRERNRFRAGNPVIGDQSATTRLHADFSDRELSRTTSTNTITQLQPTSPRRRSQQREAADQNIPESSRGGVLSLQRRGREEQRKVRESFSEQSSESDSSSSSEVGPRRQPFRSQILQRTPGFLHDRTARVRSPSNELAEDYDEDEDPVAFLPFAATPSDNEHDMGATVRSPLQLASNSRAESLVSDSAVKAGVMTDSSHSSASSAVPATLPGGAYRTEKRKSLPGERQRVEMASRSLRRQGTGREGSEGTPSMGSSFSDLDDSSVTQSALEEALLSNMRRGSLASRTSSISHASKSRFS